MIKLKNGFEVVYNKDFDIFFQNLIDSILDESLKFINNFNQEDNTTSENELLLQEIMDNCIYVTHQIFELSKVNEKFSKFIITGCIFNCAIMTFQSLKNISKKVIKDKEILH